MNIAKLFATNAVKWIANAGFLFATLLMINPNVAAHSIVPWTIYLISNIVWFIDSIYFKNKPWIWMAGFFVVWDALIVFTRLFPMLSPFN